MSILLKASPRLCRYCGICTTARSSSGSSTYLNVAKPLKLSENDSCNRLFIPHTEIDDQTKRLYDGVMKGERAVLAEAITLVESTNPVKERRAEQLLGLLLQEHQRKISNKEKSYSLRIGVSGPPGSGKSTFLESLGCFLTNDERQKKVACLTVDPSSRITGGSLLGDKTRMPNLSRNPRAFIRPSPSSGVLGGVTRTTSEALVLCEAAGYDVIFVETVGAGQNEYVVSDMVDIFVLLIAPGAGDELQAIKRGIMELCDMVLVNKADGDFKAAARRTQAEYISALKFMPYRHSLSKWRPKVLMVSSLTGDGIDKCWETLTEFHKMAVESGEFERKRREQNIVGMWRFVNDHLQDVFKSNSEVVKKTGAVEKAVIDGLITPIAGARLLIKAYRHSDGETAR